MALNYVSKAIDSLNFYINAPHIHPMDKNVTEELVKLLDQSIKFDLPINADLIGKDQMKKIISLDILHLPFPVVSIQYPAVPDPTTPQPAHLMPSPKRIALGFEFNTLNPKGIMYSLLTQALPDLIDSPSICLVAVTSQTLEPTLPEFCLQMFMVVTPLDQSIIKPHHGGAIEWAPGISSFLVPLLPFCVSNYMEKVGPHAAFNTGWTDIVEEFAAMIELLCTLACHNVSLTKEPANPKMNKKRVKNNKTRLYDTNLITIKLSQHTRQTSQELAEHKRASPCSHLRRGHIRHYTSGKMTWIPMTVIGANPIKNKDYLILK
jgi:hypothetical protein